MVAARDTFRSLRYDDIDVFYTYDWKPSLTLHDTTANDSEFPGFLECFYRSISGLTRKVNFVRLLGKEINNSTDVNEFVKTHIDINCVQAGLKVTVNEDGQVSTDESTLESFDKFLETSTLEIPDLLICTNPGNSLIRLLKKSHRLGLPYLWPSQDDLRHCDFTKCCLTPIFYSDLQKLPHELKRVICRDFVFHHFSRNGMPLIEMSYQKDLGVIKSDGF